MSTRVKAAGTAEGACVAGRPCSLLPLPSPARPASAPRRCTLSECGEEGVVAMDSARVTLVDCALSKCKGPGVDCSDNARVTVQVWGLGAGAGVGCSVLRGWAGSGGKGRGAEARQHQLQ